MNISIIVKYQFEALHRWENCPFDEVKFLKHPHRHLFYVEAEKEVTHEDRDIEIIMLKREMEMFSKSKYDYGNMSCEMIAIILLNEFNLKTCTVLEDNENGAKVYR
jgi:hypothetical protein